MFSAFSDSIVCIIQEQIALRVEGEFNVKIGIRKGLIIRSDYE